MQKALVRFDYGSLGKADRGLAKGFLEKVTGYRGRS